MVRIYRGERARQCINNAMKAQQIRDNAQNNIVRELQHGHVLYWSELARQAIAEWEYDNDEIQQQINNAVDAFKRRWKQHLASHWDKYEQRQTAFNRIMNYVSDQYNVSSTSIYYELALIGAGVNQ